MDIFTVLFFAYILVQCKTSAISKNPDFKPEEEECISELNLDRYEIKFLNKNDLVPENNLQFNKFIGCYWKKQGWQQDNGEIEYDKVGTYLKELVASENRITDPIIKKSALEGISIAVSKCKIHPPPKGSTDGQTAVRTQNCIMAELNKVFKY